MLLSRHGRLPFSVDPPLVCCSTLILIVRQIGFAAAVTRIGVFVHLYLYMLPAMLAILYFR